MALPAAPALADLLARARGAAAAEPRLRAWSQRAYAGSGASTSANASQPRFAWSGTGFVARFTGTALAASLNNTGAFIFKPVVDGTARPTFTTTTGTASYNIATGLAAGEHTVALYRQTEGGQGNSQLMSLTVTGGALMTPPAGPGKLIEVIGDSISVGYGTLGSLNDSDCFPTESHWDAFPVVRGPRAGRRGQHHRRVRPRHLPELRRRHDRHDA